MGSHTVSVWSDFRVADVEAEACGIVVGGNLGCYEWTPVVVMYSLTGTCGLVLWMDNFTLLVNELGSKSSNFP